jgi:hypothetical protein
LVDREINLRIFNFLGPFSNLILSPWSIFKPLFHLEWRLSTINSPSFVH